MKSYRHELKFSISKNMADILKQRIGLIASIDMNADLSNSYRIKSLYFDDINSTAYYEKMDGVLYRKKYRIRIYNNDDNFIRLECKYKHNTMTKKEQILIDKEIYSKIVSGKIEEIEVDEDNLLKRFLIEMKLRDLKPSIIVDYNRIAYTYPVSDTRITFDSNIKSGCYNYDLFDEDFSGYNVIDDNELVLEVKYNEVLPEMIGIIISTIPSNREAFSKFAICRSIK